MRFLIDECLSPALVTIANERGYEAYHVAHRGWSGEPDHVILQHMIDEGFTLVTNNAGDFRGLVGNAELHPGLIVFPGGLRRDDQQSLMELAIEAAEQAGSVLNKVIELDERGRARVYDLPDT